MEVPGGAGGRTRLVFGVVGCVLLLLLLARLLQPIVVGLLAAVEGVGWPAPFLLALAYVLVSFPFLHGYAVLTMSAGFLFGVVEGIVVVVGGATLGAGIAWFVSKHFWADYLKQQVNTNKYSKAVLRAVEKRPFRIVFLCRLVPVPFGIMNAILSMSSIDVSVYMAGTALGLIPEGLLGCYFGTTMRSLHEVKEHGIELNPVEIIAVTFTAVAVGVVVWLLIRAGQEALLEADDDEVSPSALAKP